MKKIKFNKDGGKLSVEVICGYAQPGSYDLILWEPLENKKVKEWSGNFINTQDDRYDLPQPLKDNHERIVECFVTVAILPPMKNYYVELKVMQDGTVVGTEFVSGESDQPAVTVDLFFRLIGE